MGKMGLNVFEIVLGLIKGSGKWRKAAECKRLINEARGHLIIQKKRREVIIRQSRIDIAHLLQNGLQHNALPRVDQLYKDQCRLSAYEQVEKFCDCIDSNLRDISKGCELSKDVREAISSLIFAASRCGELPELNLLRYLFQQRFGQEFERVNVQLLPENCVNSELKHNLSTSFVPDDVKRRMVNEIEEENKVSSVSPIDDKTLVPENQKVVFCTCSSKFLSLICLQLQLSWLGHNGQRKKKVEFRNLASRLVDDKSTRASKFEDMVRRTGSKVSHTEEPRLSHVHPKLRDYDNLVAKFTDLKEDYMQKRGWMWC